MAENWSAIVIARHGITSRNMNGALVSRVDDPLTSEGQLQALELKAQLRSINFSKYYSSPLSRANETAQIVAGPRLQEVIKVSNFTERDFGQLEGQPYCKIKQIRDQFLQGGAGNNEFEIETDTSLNERVIPFLKDIATAYLGLSVFIATHSGIIRFILNHVGKKYADTKDLTIPNCGYIEIKSDGTTIKYAGSSFQI